MRSAAENQPWLEWNRPSWRAEAVAWGEAALRELRRPVVGEVRQPHVRPWATALTLPTAEGTVWLKAAIAPLAHEAATLELLTAAAQRLAPALLAANRDRGWMLIEDAGRRLREIVPPPLERWEETVALYAQLQLDLAHEADRLIAAGVPDRRGPRLAAQLDELLADDDVLRPSSGAALSDDELGRLRAAARQIATDVEALDQLGVPASIHHDDLHDGNVFLDGDECRVIDWGDACISHPLLTIDLTLRVVDEDFGPSEAARVRDAYLEPFTALVPRDDLLAAEAARTRAADACNAVKWYDVMRGIPRESWDEFADAVPLRLRRFLARCG